jgi:probable phosphoglycerate mutase
MHAARLRNESFDALISSDLGRARSTAEFIATQTGHAVNVDARLRERHYGVFQGMTRGEARAAYPEVYARYCDESVSDAIAGGESTQECFARNVACLTELAARYAGKRLVVVAHGGVLDGFYRHVMRLPHVGARAFTIVNASLNWFTCADGEWHLVRWGDVAHLGLSESLDDV